MARLLITGGGSYLGRHLVPLALRQPDTAVGYTIFRHDPWPDKAGYSLDVRDATAVAGLITSFRPDAIIHTVGSNRGDDMENVIRLGTAHVVEAATAVSARLVHLSSDVVFDGRSAPYDETAEPAPLHAYGCAKADAEALVRRHPDHVIVRTSLIYGLDSVDRGTEWMIAALRAREPVTLFTDQIRNPVWAETLGRACLELALASSYRGILNVAGQQALTRAAFGLKMLDYWGIVARETLWLGGSDPDLWPANCTLDLALATAVLATPLPGVDEVLAGHAKN